MPSTQDLHSKLIDAVTSLVERVQSHLKAPQSFSLDRDALALFCEELKQAVSESAASDDPGTALRRAVDTYIDAELAAKFLKKSRKDK